MSSGQQATRTQGAGPVVICCAAADAGAIATVARELQADGHTVEVVAGVESDPRRLAPVIDRCRGEGLYVLCRSRSLGRDAVDELRDVLLARHVPFGRTLTVASTRPRELRERIVASLSRVAAGRVRKMANVPPEGAPPRVRRSTQLGIPSPIVQPRPEPRDDAAAAAEREKKKRRGTQLGIPVADVARLARQMHEKEDTATSKPSSPDEDTVASARTAEPDTRVDAVPTDSPEPDTFEEEVPTNTRLRAPRNAAAAAAREAREATAKALEEPPTEPLAKAASREEIAIRTSEPDPETDTLEFSKQEVRVVKPPPPPPPSRAAAKPAPPPEPAVTEDSVGRAVITPEDLADLGGTDPKIELGPLGPEDDFDAMPIRSGDTKVQSLVEAGLDVRSGNTAVVHVDDIRSGLTVRVPAVPLQSETPSPSPASAEIGAPVPMAGQERSRSSFMLPAALAGGALLLGIVAAVALTGGEDDEGDDDAVAKSDAANRSAPADAEGGGNEGAPESDGGEGSERTAAELAVGAPRTKVGEALRSREVQALDILLVTSKTAGPFEYAAATDHCAGLEVAGLSGWRLPDIGELMSLSAAGMTGSGFYWSTTPADTFGDAHLVWYAKRSRVVEREKPNFVVCVRGSVDE